ncbi:hypothetical protein [Novosphingobium sp.]|uniref:hypothetical protein n=1 Tax=Novosphingobium sp. TaxID=1874826 RepID=UPI0035B1627A
MKIPRREAMLGLGGIGAALLLPAEPARANLATDNWSQLQPIFARHWYGGGIGSTRNTVDGTLPLEFGIDFGPADDMHFNGRHKITSRWDTGTYSAVFGISGYFWGTENTIGLVIESSYKIAGDALPADLYWQGMTGQLQLYPDRTSPGHWLLDGMLYGLQDGVEFHTQLKDSPQ